MNAVPEYRAVLGVDAVGSASLPIHHHSALHRAIGAAVDAGLALHGVGPADLLDREDTGDGLLITAPSGTAGALLDAAHSIERLLTAHNTLHKPELRLRMAVEVGPVADGRGLAATKIALARMLDAEAFRTLFRRCLAERPADALNSALVVSDQVRRTVLDGGHTAVVRAAEFARLRLINKEFDGTAWVRVPGCDADTLARLADSAEPDEEQGHGLSVVNTVHGGMRGGIQAGVINAPITLGGSR